MQFFYTEEEISNLEAVVPMLSCGALERSNNPYIKSIVEPSVFKNQKEILGMWIWLERKSWRRTGVMVKKYPWAESGICACVKRKKNSFEITVIIFKAYKKCKSPFQKGF